MKYRTLIILLSLFIGFSSCEKDDNDVSEQLTKDIAIIENYLENNNIDAQKTSSGLYYVITEEGTGLHPTINSTVTVQYKGKLLDGTIFDNNTATFRLTGVIAGWQEGIPLFKKGGRGKLFIPSGLGYGASGTSDGSIPGNTVITFDIHLISFY